MSKRTGTNDRPPWWVVAFATVGLVALGVAYWALSRPGRSLLWHSQIGDALAPVASFLSLFAVIAALWAVHVQRIELAENRRVMEEQKEQFERTAKAQEALAESQKRLADAQAHANRLSLEATLAEYASSISALQAARVRIEIERVKVRSPGRQHENVESEFDISSKLVNLEVIAKSLATEYARVRGLTTSDTDS